MKQEAILLDLLRVVSHHRARLATPIRTVQKIYSEPASENIPFGDSIFTRSRAAVNRPFLLIEPPYKVNGEDKAKPSTRSTRGNEEKDAKVDEPVASDSKSDENFAGTSTSPSSVNSKDKSKSKSDAQTQNMGSDSSVEKTSKTMQPKKETAEDVGKGSTIPVPKTPAHSVVSETLPVITNHESSRADTASATSSQSKQDEEKSSVPSSAVKPPLEENILLGVALEGSKRTLPIEEEMNPSPNSAESQEFAVQRNGNGPPANKDKKDGPTSSFPNAKQND
jgi:mechanosensitive ion channel protein 1/2/3